MIISRDEPEIKAVQFEDERFNLYDFYNEEDNVVFYEKDECTFAFDFDEMYIMFDDGEEVFILNILYALKEVKELYNKFFEERSKWKKR